PVWSRTVPFSCASAAVTCARPRTLVVGRRTSKKAIKRRSFMKCLLRAKTKPENLTNVRSSKARAYSLLEPVRDRLLCWPILHTPPSLSRRIDIKALRAGNTRCWAEFSGWKSGCLQARKRNGKDQAFSPAEHQPKKNAALFRAAFRT